MLGITFIDVFNWKVGLHHYQTLPKALSHVGTDHEKLLHLYNESLELFKQRHHVKKTPSGEYEITTVNGKLYSRNVDRLKMLSFETLLKSWMLQIKDVVVALQNINDEKTLVKKSFCGK